MDPAALRPILDWLEEVPFSKENCLRNITREFSDGYCIAEIMAHFIPKLVDMNMYHPISATPQKIVQWKTLNKKTLSKIDVNVPEMLVRQVVNYKEGAAGLVLRNLKLKVESYLKPERKDSADGDRAAGPKPINKAKLAAAVAKKKKGKKKALQAGSREVSSISDVGSVSDESILAAVAEKDRIIDEYSEVVGVFQTKVKELERLLKLKDRRIEDLVRKCKENGIAVAVR